MPRATKSKSPNPDAVYTSWQTFATRDRVVIQGTRLRGSDPVVREHPGWFLPDGAPADELQAKAAEDTVATLAEVRRPPPPAPAEPLRDEAAVVATRDVDATLTSSASPDGRALTMKRGIRAGDKLPKGDPIVKRNPRAFADVTRDVPRSEALVATQTLRNVREDGSERVLFAGQWARFDDELVTANRPLFRPPDPEPR